MKNYKRHNPMFSLCGLNCNLCPMNIGGYCPGRGGGEGNQPCAFFRCAQEHGQVEYCRLCEQFPCQRYRQAMEYDSFIPHTNMLQDQEQAIKIGLGPYMTRLEHKRAILDELLAHWNDGRRKSLYCLAVYHLELEDLVQVLEQLNSRVLPDIDLKKRVAEAVEALQETANQRGVVLKLRKKPKEK